jgi:polyisoprenyl-phosphate glycosyltransferase
MSDSADGQLVSVVVPVFNESEVIGEFHRRTSDVLGKIPGIAFEIVYVDDGSRDDSHAQLVDLAAKDRRVRVVKLSRNFGHQSAITAGLDLSRGDAVVLIDADLQDPPEVIEAMVAKWREGYDVVYGRRTLREGESRAKLVTASVFYRLLRRVTNIDIPNDVGDFRLLSRRAANELRMIRENDRFVRGLVSWIGFRQTGVDYRRDVRYAGRTKFPYAKMVRFALDGITSFSNAPLRVATWFGYAASGLAFLYLLSIPAQYLLGITVPGFSTIMVAMLFLGGTQLICIGILGEYIGRIFNEVKRRPLYIVEEVTGQEPGEAPIQD